MNLYRKTHKQFFFDCARLRNMHFINALSFKDIASGKWVTEDEIEDFTLAYMAGGEL